MNSKGLTLWHVDRYRPYVAVGYWLTAAVLTHLPPRLTVPNPFPSADRVLHFATYFGLAIAVAWGFAEKSSYFQRLFNRGELKKVCLVLAAALAVWGALDELTQPFVRRYADPIDWLADVAGIVAGLACWGLLRGRHLGRR